MPCARFRSWSISLLLGGTIALAVTPASATATARGACDARELLVAGGCVSEAAAARRVTALTRETMRSLGMRATILRVDTASGPLVARGFGTSMAGQPARPDMHFRIGSMAIPHLITVLLQLQDAGRLSLDDQLSRFLPGMPNAERVTLRMLANNTSGYSDWIQGNQPFVDALLADPFRQWTPDELLAQAFARDPACAPGTCFSYAHTNYAVLSKVVERVTGQSATRAIRSRVLRPLRLHETRISRDPGMPSPVLHAYTADRGPYEDSTFWSPSWTIGAGTVMSATIGDIARTARAMGRGTLLSPAASRERFAPTTAAMPPFSPEVYYGLGVVVSHGWYVQNPMLNGYTGAMGYLPSQKLSIAVVATQRENPSVETAYASRLFEKLTAYLAPGATAVLPG